jgi:hypothetical protein
MLSSLFFGKSAHLPNVSQPLVDILLASDPYWTHQVICHSKVKLMRRSSPHCS